MKSVLSITDLKKKIRDYKITQMDLVKHLRNNGFNVNQPQISHAINSSLFNRINDAVDEIIKNGPRQTN